MAQSIETLRNKILTSIHGRRLGLDSDETIVGPKDVKRAVQDLTSGSTGTTLNAYGLIVARISGAATTAAGGVFILPNPIPGVAIDLSYAGTSQGATAGSTAIAFLRGSTAFYIQSTVGTTGVAVLLPQGTWARLLGVSTDLYHFQGTIGTSITSAAAVTGTS
ncbi:MAG: hypothetical protein ACYC36_03565 [Bellilinea sp.]